MAITDKKTGPWGLDQVYNKINQGSIWSYYDFYANANGELFTWGENQKGQLGHNDRTYRSSPTQITGGGSGWSRLIRGAGMTNTHSGAIKSDGTLWMWGNNEEGALGQNEHDVHRSSPVQVGSATNWSGGAVSVKATIMVNTDGELWAWGSNAGGFLGQSQPGNTQYSSPVQIPGTTWVDVLGGYESAGAVKTDGTLWIWGANGKGNLGQNNTTSYESPVQVGSDTTWRIDNNTGISGMTSRFIKTDGTLWSWGYNNGGGLGLNDTVQYSSPVQIPGTDWASVGGSSYNGIAIKTDGTLWTWGTNSKGQLGTNQTNGLLVSSPVQVPGTTWAYGYIPNQKYVLAAKTDGTLWSWGYGVWGQLGQNSRTHYSSPVQIAGGWSTKFNGISGATGSSFGIKPVAS